MDKIKTKSAGGVVINNDGNILIVNQHNNSWSLPKGHIEKDENPLEAAKREIYEESGVKNLSLIKSLGSYKRFRIGLKGGDDFSEEKEIFLFLFQTDQIKLSPIDPDNPEARWVKPREVCSYLSHKKDIQFFHNLLNSKIINLNQID